MCVIWPPPESVNKTVIFGRSDGRNQCLMYQMSIAASDNVAMILPVPVRLPAQEDSVAFIDVSADEKILSRLSRAFPSPINVLSFAEQTWGTLGAAARAIPVHNVGSYIASFVPTNADFSRLDKRFRLPDSFWKEVHTYDDWGFAVFQLNTDQDVVKDIEPMAFVFETRFPDQVYFPTLHLHSEHVEMEAQFDHILLTQGLECGPRPELNHRDATVEGRLAAREGRSFSWEPPSNRDGWYDSIDPFAQIYQTDIQDHMKDLFDFEKVLFKRRIVGKHPNQDLWANVVDLGSNMNSPESRILDNETRSDESVQEPYSAGAVDDWADGVLEAEKIRNNEAGPNHFECSVSPQGRPQSLRAHWQGQASLASAFWLVGAVGGIAFAAVYQMLHSTPVGLIVGIAWFCYSIFAIVSVWRCAWNTSWMGWGYAARIIVPLKVVSAVGLLSKVLTQ